MTVLAWRTANTVATPADGGGEAACGMGHCWTGLGQVAAWEYEGSGIDPDDVDDGLA